MESTTSFRLIDIARRQKGHQNYLLLPVQLLSSGFPYCDVCLADRMRKTPCLRTDSTLKQQRSGGKGGSSKNNEIF